jgi:iron complex outermembrane receptor protein
VFDAQTTEALLGATVSIKGTNNGATTGTDGVFKIVYHGNFPVTLVFRYVGYDPQEVALSANKVLDIYLAPSASSLEEIVVTARRRIEEAQEIPIPISVISGKEAENSLAFNVNRIKELLPSVQLYSSNARNTTLNIRGLGSTFGLTNDGLDPGVGFYIDGVYHARPAATALDFVDVNQIEILRGPQGTLFGKNTTAGAFNISSLKPSSTPSGKAELSYGNYNFVQAKATFTGPLAKNLSHRFSFSGTQRTGTIFNETEQQNYNGLNNMGLKGQLLYKPTERLEIHLLADYNNQRPDGASLVTAGVTRTLRSEYRQYYKILEDLGYPKPKIDPFARKIYTNTPWKHNQSIGGTSLNIDYKIGKGYLTATTAWRFWNWDPVNDRDFTEVAALTKSQAPSRHDQYSQEIRYAGDIANKLSGTIGVFYLSQNLVTSPYHEEEVGKDQWRFVQTANTGTQALYSTPGLLDNYGIRTYSSLKSLSSAVFAQADWEVLKGLHLIGGLRYNYDKKDVVYDRKTYGGLNTTNATLLSLKRAVYSDQKFNTTAENTNLSGNLTLSYRPSEKITSFLTYSTAYKPVGVNVGGLPTVSSGEADLSLAVIKPEFVKHFEVGVKTNFSKGLILNLTAFNTDINDYQTIVQSPQLGVNRGYLANAEKVNVKGVEADAHYRIGDFLNLRAAVAYTDGKYVTFTNAPLPLEETGKTTVVNGVAVQQAFKDASGGRLPGISRWNATFSAEWSKKVNLFGKAGRVFIGADASYRSEYSSNPTPSAVLNIAGYGLLNPRVGFSSDQFSITLWSRNVTNTNYFEQLQPAGGNSGLYAGVLGDPRTYGITLRYNLY